MPYSLLSKLLLDLTGPHLCVYTKHAPSVASDVNVARHRDMGPALHHYVDAARHRYGADFEP